MSMRDNAPEHDELLIEAVTKLIGASSARREECRNRIISCIQSAKAYREINNKIGLPSKIKRNAAALRGALAKAQMLAKEIEHFFSSVLDDMVEYDVSRNYATFQQCLNDGIAASSGIERQIVVPKGKKPRNFAKYQAKAIAVDLVGGFSGTYNERLQNDVASLLYELLTGIADVDIPENADDHRVPFLQTRGRIKS